MKKLLRTKLAWVFLAALFTVMLLAAGCGGRGGGEQTSSQTGSGSSSNGGQQSDSQTSSEETKPEKNPLAGKTIRLVVPYSPGGGFDVYARMVAPYLEKYADATVVVQNVTGAGGIVGANTVYTSEPDGTTIGILGGASLVFAQASGTDGVEYDAGKYRYLARVSADPSVLIISNQRTYSTMADLVNAGTGLKMGSDGVGEDDFYTWSTIFKAFRLNDYAWVTGWEGSSQRVSAVAAGAIDGTVLSAGSALPPIKDGFAHGIIQVAPERDSRLPDVPTALEAAGPEDDRELIETITNILVADRVLVAPPGADDETTQALRNALNQALHDPELANQANQAQRPIAYMSGEDLNQAIESSMRSVEKLKPIFDEAASKAQ